MEHASGTGSIVRRLLILLTVSAVALAACTTGTPSPASSLSAVTESPVVLTTIEESPKAVPSTTVPEPLTFVSAADLLASDTITAEQVREAAAVLGGHSVGVAFPEVFEEGDLEIRQAVLEVLSVPTAWNAQILVGMSMGRPRAGFVNLEPWTNTTRPSGWETLQEIIEVRDVVLGEMFGDDAGVAAAAMRYLQLNVEGSDVAWYDIPVVVNRIEGERNGGVFTGAISIASSTGEGSDYQITAVDSVFGWIITEVDPPFSPLIYGELTSVPDVYTLETMAYLGFAGSGGAAGSGCAPGTDELPDGAWFGHVVERTLDGVVLNLACWWSGDMANKIALIENNPEVHIPNDYLITNHSDRLRTVPVTSSVSVRPIQIDGLAPETVPFSEWPLSEWPLSGNSLGCQLGGEHDFCIVWIYINDGVVTEIAEQYVP